MPSQTAVHAAEPRDFPEIAKLIRVAYSKREYCSREEANEQYLIDNNEFALVVKIDDVVIGTMLVTYDCGELPCDELFEKETEAVRAVSKKVAYYGSFAVEPNFWQSEMSIGFMLIGEAINMAIKDGVDAGICIVNPRHVRFYRALGFKIVGKTDNMPRLKKAPAVMLAITGKKARDLLFRCNSLTNKIQSH
jgi:ribosomal protein S18 acetylase RimI-like enzyme